MRKEEGWSPVLLEQRTEQWQLQQMELHLTADCEAVLGDTLLLWANNDYLILMGGDTLSRYTFTSGWIEKASLWPTSGFAEGEE